jgi:fucose permease
MLTSGKQEQSIHYAWVIVVTGMICIVACLGFGRFALGMLLPSMASTLKLSYSQIGFISTGNFVGYLIAVLFCGRIAAKTGSRVLIVAALVMIALSAGPTISLQSWPSISSRA